MRKTIAATDSAQANRSGITTGRNSSFSRLYNVIIYRYILLCGIIMRY